MCDSVVRQDQKIDQQNGQKGHMCEDRYGSDISSLSIFGKPMWIHQCDWKNKWVFSGPSYNLYIYVGYFEIERAGGSVIYGNSYGRVLK